MGVPVAIPRIRNLREFQENPLDSLLRARGEFGDLVVLRDGGPLFSGAEDCAGSVVAFGCRHNRSILSDIETFGMPVPISARYGLPPTLAKLTSGLFSMRGKRHREHQQLLAKLLRAESIGLYHGHLAAGLEAFVESWRPCAKIPLLSEMRRLALNVADRQLFGTAANPPLEIGALVQNYFQQRRSYASPLGSADAEARAELIAIGTRLDAALRRRMGDYHSKSHRAPPCLLAQLARSETSAGHALTEDELVAHSNVLFMSSSEPIAVSLTWIFLLLSQLPRMRHALRCELRQISASDRMPRVGDVAQLSLLDSVVHECLRLLPPNAIMVRLTTRPVELGAHTFPEHCEVVLSPYATHRDPLRFPRAGEFLPGRWRSVKPSPFEFFPFGAGGRYCMGKHLAIHTIKVAIAFLLRRHDLLLSGDQEIDWRMDVNLMPANEPIVQIAEPAGSAGGRLLGAAADLVRLTSAST